MNSNKSLNLLNEWKFKVSLSTKLYNSKKIQLLLLFF